MLLKGSKTVLEYWQLDRNNWPVLQELALRVFAMTCSSAASKQKFSTFGFVHTKLRNSLSGNSVKKLVYIKTNAMQLSDELMKLEEVGNVDNEEDNISSM